MHREEDPWCVHNLDPRALGGGPKQNRQFPWGASYPPIKAFLLGLPLSPATIFLFKHLPHEGQSLPESTILLSPEKQIKYIIIPHFACNLSSQQSAASFGLEINKFKSRPRADRGKDKRQRMK